MPVELAIPLCTRECIRGSFTIENSVTADTVHGIGIDASGNVEPEGGCCGTDAHMLSPYRDAGCYARRGEQK